jgi:hypothetical protein
MKVEDATDAGLSRASVQSVLGPKLAPGYISVMKDRRVHKVTSIRWCSKSARHMYSSCRLIDVDRCRPRVLFLRAGGMPLCY